MSDTTRTPGLTSFLAAQGGMTGAEKALLVCFGLAIVGIGGALVSRGSGSAARDAQRALTEGGAGAGAMGDVLKPMQSAGTMAAPGKEGAPAGLRAVSLVSFSKDFGDGDAPPPPPPPPAPQRPPEGRARPLPAAEYTAGVIRSGGRIDAVYVQRLGLLPRSDPHLRWLREELGNTDIDPESVHGIITVWRREQGGSAVVDGRGNVGIVSGDRRVLLWANGAGGTASDANSNHERDAQGRVVRFAFTGRSGTTVFLRRSFEFRYGPDGQPDRVEVLGGASAGTWTRGPGGQWTGGDGRRWTGADPPGTWAQVLGGRTRLHGIVGAANDAIDAEWARLRALYQQHLPPNDTLGLTSLRTVVGAGFSGNIGTMQRLSGEITAIRQETDALRAMQRAIAASEDPAEIGRLGRDFSRRAEALRDRIDRFRTDSQRMLGQAAMAGRAWSIAKDAYGLGNAGGPVTGLWNLGKLIKDIVGN